MNFIDLPIQFQVEVDDANITAELKGEAERRLLDLFEAHDDLTGAEISITAIDENPDQPYRYEVRVCLYAWPGDLVAVKKADAVQVALRRALDAIEHRVHHQTRNHREHSKRRELHDWQADDLKDERIFVGAIYDARLVQGMLAEA